MKSALALVGGHGGIAGRRRGAAHLGRAYRQTAQHPRRPRPLAPSSKTLADREMGAARVSRTVRTNRGIGCRSLH